MDGAHRAQCRPGAIRRVTKADLAEGIYTNIHRPIAAAMASNVAGDLAVSEPSRSAARREAAAGQFRISAGHRRMIATIAYRVKPLEVWAVAQGEHNRLV
ncbi:hypothetical protein BraRD5C2_35620 [Bradyrhizobium sp. RD5-C2]|nr:hypothetical protein BraRD5C2_35620 [Bradyrhizobium sp. RD5-C2]